MTRFVSQSLLLTSVASALMVFALLQIGQPPQRLQSYYLPTLLNAVQPRLIAGDRASIEPTLHQLVRGSAVQRVDLYEADGGLIASVRNPEQPDQAGMQRADFNAAIVIDSTLLANLSVEELQPVTGLSFTEKLFIALISGLAVLGGGVISRRVSAPTEPTSNAEITPIEGLQAFAQEDSSDVCLVMVIRLSDLQEGLLSRGELDDYGDTLWSLIERMGPAYGLCCLGVTEGNLLLAANASNPALALRHCVMFGWNIGGLSADRYGRPATWVGLAKKQGSNACYSWMTGSFEGAGIALERSTEVEPGQFEISKELAETLPRSVETSEAAADSVRVISLDPAMLALWKRQLQSSS